MAQPAATSAKGPQDVERVAVPSASRTAGAPQEARVLRGQLLMPLATGAAALSALTVPVGVIQLIAFGPFFISEVPDWVPRWVGSVIVLVFGVLWAVWFFVVIGSIVEGWRRRASDVRLAPDGLRIIGGPAGGMFLGWEEVRDCKIDEGLWLNGRVVARSNEPGELQSFAAIAQTVHALQKPATLNADTPPRVLHCPSCGAPAAPTPEPQSPCRFCGASVPMPSEVQSRFAAAGQLSRSREQTERLLRALLRQRGARFTNAVLALAIPPLLLGLPLTAMLFNELRVVRHVLNNAHALWLFPFAVCFTYGLLIWLHGHVVGRAAIRLVALRYRARPPRRDKEPWSCRRCAAPLPESSGQLIVLCLYCEAENLTGIDLHEDSAQMEAQAGELAATLQSRLRQRRRWRLLSLCALLLLALSVGALAGAFPRTCRDGIQNGEETDTDCGGACLRCPPGRRCKVPTDCISGVCKSGICASPSCRDGVQNSVESDVDCGGPCAPCPAGYFCRSGSDCQGGRCALSGRCE